MNRKYSSKNFNLEFFRRKDRLFLYQQVVTNIVSTKDLPRTLELLSAKIPTIFQNECFNDKNNTFRKECSETEIGHLLEHLILENLKLLIEEKKQKADFLGETVWDWNKDKYGLYKIIINIKHTPTSVFKKAIENSLAILEEIFATVGGEDPTSPPPFVS